MAAPTLLGTTPTGGTLWQRDDGSQFETPYPMDMFGQTSYVDPYGAPPPAVPESIPVGLDAPPAPAPSFAPPVAPEVSGSPIPGPPPIATPYAGAPAKPSVPPTATPQAAPAPSQPGPPSIGEAAAQAAADTAEQARHPGLKTQEDVLGYREEADLEKSKFHREQMEQIQAADERRAAENEQRRAEADAKVDRDMMEIRALSDEVRNAKIDPDALWAGDGGTMRHILGIASVFAAGIANPNGPNQAAQIISQAIDRNIAAQQANLDNKRRAIGDRQSLLDRFAAVTGDRYKAAEAVRQAGYQRAIDMLATAESQYDDPQIRAKYAEARIQVQAAASAAEQKAAQDAWERKMAEREQNRKEYETKQQVGQGWSRIGLDRARLNMERQKAAEEQAKAQGIDPELAVQGAGVGESGVAIALGKESAKIMKERKAGAEAWIEANQQLMNLKKKYPGKLWNNWASTSEGSAAIESLAQDMINTYSVMNGQGAQGDAERANNFRAKVGDPYSFINRYDERRWQESILGAERVYSALARNHLRGVSGEFKYNPATQAWRKVLPNETGAGGFEDKATLGEGQDVERAAERNAQEYAEDVLVKKYNVRGWSDIKGRLGRAQSSGDASIDQRLPPPEELQKEYFKLVEDATRQTREAYGRRQKRADERVRKGLEGGQD